MVYSLPIWDPFLNYSIKTTKVRPPISVLMPFWNIHSKVTYLCWANNRGIRSVFTPITNLYIAYVSEIFMSHYKIS
jgi:hypothetical protein